MKYISVWDNYTARSLDYQIVHPCFYKYNIYLTISQEGHERKLQPNWLSKSRQALNGLIDVTAVGAAGGSKPTRRFDVVTELFQHL